MLEAEKVEDIFRIWHKARPEPVGELAHENHYQLIVAVVLSAQATDVSVNKATTPLFKTVKCPEDMLRLGEETLLKAIRAIGLYKTKAKHVMELSRILVANFNSTVPSTLAELMSLPGVGRKTANVVLNAAFGVPTIAVDTHVYRVSRRLGFSKAKTVDTVERDLQKCVPKAYALHAHHWMILHGRYICKARTPLCAQCSISHLCSSKDKLESSI